MRWFFQPHFKTNKCYVYIFELLSALVDTCLFPADDGDKSLEIASGTWNLKTSFYTLNLKGIHQLYLILLV